MNKEYCVFMRALS